MTNRLPPTRKLAALRLAGRNRLSQLEATAALEVLVKANETMFQRFGDTQKHRARCRAIDKLQRALNLAQKQSIPKGLTARPAFLPTIYDEE